ncbi:MAG: hypothetical protein O3C21_01710 [Verrucomicrobia bacterium]|nr:hypothetical protein [Verrucomicrobiota bacterium]
MKIPLRAPKKAQGRFRPGAALKSAGWKAQFVNVCPVGACCGIRRKSMLVLQSSTLQIVSKQATAGKFFDTENKFYWRSSKTCVSDA